MQDQRCKIEDAIKRTQHFGKHIVKMDDFETRDQVDALLEIATYLEPLWKSGALNFLPGKVMGSLFFEPSTRTRLGTQISMHKLGGQVMADATPLITSRLATGASLEDELETLSTYVDIISMRHTYVEDALNAVEKGAKVPVISGGFGGYEHPVAGYTDMFTTLMSVGRLHDLNVLIIGASQTLSRVAHSYAFGMAKYPNNRIVLATDKDAPNPPEVLARLRDQKVDCEEILSPTRDQVYELMKEADIVNLSGFVNCVPSDSEEKEEFFETFGRKSPYYVTHEQMERIEKEKGKVVGLMHPFPRYPGMEMDESLDTTPYALYWRQMDYAQPARMAMILSQIYSVM